ncbi:hypothetical protein GYMLUDRAFT_47157 [Collybiopsis luxurians FD-317 M1]|uniref:Uncharacterized protein n=1 Tax=Collybiopsis luxurians FD-317 M1 TaxID=944289 RepID=A0A0D0CEA5_9AGAR|nr:hypothetical protein GYMLUDRAFT_47157 [Collybiopsis luxurians FD-317 M1]
MRSTSITLLLALLPLFASLISATPVFGIGKKKGDKKDDNKSKASHYIISLYANADCSGQTPYGQIISGYVEGPDQHHLPEGHTLQCVEMVTAWNQPCKFNLLDYTPKAGAPSNGLGFISGWPKGKFPINGEAKGVQITCDPKPAPPQKDDGKKP